MDDDELRELQNPENWDRENAQVHSPEKDVGAVIAVRFTAEEFKRMARRAAEADLPLTSFVRNLVLERIAEGAAR